MMHYDPPNHPSDKPILRLAGTPAERSIIAPLDLGTFTGGATRRSDLTSAGSPGRLGILREIKSATINLSSIDSVEVEVRNSERVVLRIDGVDVRFSLGENRVFEQGDLSVTIRSRAPGSNDELNSKFLCRQLARAGNPPFEGGRLLMSATVMGRNNFELYLTEAGTVYALRQHSARVAIGGASCVSATLE